MSFDENARTSHRLNLPPGAPPPRQFRSLRWRLVTPLVAIILVILMTGTYVIAYAFVQGEEAHEDSELLATSRGIATGALDLGAEQRLEAQRLAYTIGVPQAVQADDAMTLQTLIKPLAGLGGLDLVIVAGEDGHEILGLRREPVAGSIEYTVASGSEIENIHAVQRVLDGEQNASGLITIERRLMLVTAGGVMNASQESQVGVILVGMDITRILQKLKSGQPVDLALFSGDGNAIGSTFDGGGTVAVDIEIYDLALGAFDQALTEGVRLYDEDYRVAYFPFVIGEARLGVLGAYQPEYAGTATEFGRQVISLTLALAVAVIYIVGYILTGIMTGRIEKVREVVDGLAAGNLVRTGMKSRDEIGQLGVAVDRYAEAVQVKARQMQQDLLQHRRQLAHLELIFENIPDGVVVQDMEGRVMTMNATARNLLGITGQTGAASALREWSGTVSDTVGKILVPGIQALDETIEMRIGQHIIDVRAARLVSVADKRVGTVIVLRDVTHAAEREARREQLIDEIASDIHVSMEQRAQAAALEDTTRSRPVSPDSLMDFAREVSRDARGIQRLITEYRDLTILDSDDIRERQRPVNVSDLMGELVNVWKPSALGAELSFEVELLEGDDLFILGDEKRLLWAVGNVIDNAIKYSLPGGEVVISAYPHVEQSRVIIKIADEGVGITPEDQAQLFTRFYRGTPRSSDGTILEVPGTGQGLYLALKIVKAHGGQIALASVPGEGTQVTFSLPLTAEVALEIPAGIPSRAEQDSAPLVAAEDVEFIRPDTLPEIPEVELSIWDMPTTRVEVVSDE